MVNVASLDLCKELYEASGWDDLPDRKGWQEAGAPLADVPRYDLGYLIRKLGPGVEVMRAIDSYSATRINFDMRYIADTPEDAAARLAVELFKRGILAK